MSNYKDLSTGELQRLASQGNYEAGYWLGDKYYDSRDYRNAAELWDKVITQLPTSHELFKKAACNLSLLHQDGLHPNSDDNEAIRLYEMVPNKGPISVLALGLLYCEVQGRNHNPAKGIGLVEDTIRWFVNEDGNDEYISSAECFRIARMYYKEAVNTQSTKYIPKASEYAEKTIRRHDPARPSDVQRAEAAKSIIEECTRITRL